MYQKQIKDLNTVTWHNLHFILEHYANETLTVLEQIIAQAESGDMEVCIDPKTALEIKSEVVATVNTLKAMHTVANHHRNCTSKAHYAKESDDEKISLAS